MLRTLAICFTLAPAASAFQANDFVVPAGASFVYDTDVKGPLVADNVIIEAGGALRAFGTQPFKVYANGKIRIDGTVDLSGFDSLGVVSLNTTNLPEPGGLGGPAGGRGGTGSWQTTTSTPYGGKGFGPLAWLGGGGGETGWHDFKQGTAFRRGAGGGGGAFAANQPVSSNLEDPANLGLVARPGHNGGREAFGAISGALKPHGGRAGKSVFVDADATNDFYGRKLDPQSGQIILGELLAPIGGSGGGAGGDAAFTSGQSFPKTPFSPSGDEKGSGGGGGGGLGVFVANEFVLGPAGRLRCDGGKGGGGENTNFFDRVGGGSGGGSGGMVVIQAAKIDLSATPDKAITARGGLRGPGKFDVTQQPIEGQGGHGGPGLVQLHIADAQQIFMPAGKTLSDLVSPAPHVLIPNPNL
ncbi:MAG: hypothetical protein L6Q99_22140 [Planctomycetes bacterium]|nr:hypothetical protein [Planctomycetota bacterium]